MIKRHEDQLWARLDKLYSTGTAHITWGEIYHWYDLQRISKAPWRDIYSRWQQLLEEKNEEYRDPQVAELRDGVAFFFAHEPNSLSEKAQ